MKRVVLAALTSAALIAGAVQSASAADMPVKGPVLKAPAMVVAQRWTGCYGGVVGAYQWGRSNQYYGGSVGGVPNPFLPTGFDMTGDTNVSGPHIGGTLGCNYQMPGSNWVVGLEADLNYVSAKGNTPPSNDAIVAGLNQNFRFTTDQHWMATVRGRLGYDIGQSTLVYVTGGLVAGGFELNNYNGTAVATAQRIPDKVTKTGWVAGIGVERALTSTATLKAEALYADYGKMHYGDAIAGCTAGCANGDVKMTAIIARLGINIKFF